MFRHIYQRNISILVFNEIIYTICQIYLKDSHFLKIAIARKVMRESDLAVSLQR